MRLFMPFLTALFIVMVAVPLLMKLAVPLGFVDQPDARKLHPVAVPRVGGIGMVFGSVLAVCLWLEVDATLGAILAGVGLLSLFGILDDRCDLNYRLKFLGQSLAVLVVVGLGGVVVRRLEWLGMDALPELVAYPLTFLFLLGATNAMNLSDGLDGLAAGLSVLSLAVIAYLADLAGGGEVVGVAVVIIGAILGFLRYNTHPAVVFMGDTGSQFLGFSIGVLAVLTTQQVNTAVGGGLPLLILGLPVVDTLLVMGDRLARRVSPFKPDRNHFHHKLLSLGFDHCEAVLGIYALQALFICLAIFLRYESDGLVLGVYAALFAGLAAFFPVALGLRWRIRVLTQGQKSPLTRYWEQLSAPWLERAVYYGANLLLVSVVVAGGLSGHGVGTDLGACALGILAAWLLAVLVRRWAWAERLALYSCVILVIYLLGKAEGWRYPHYAVVGLAGLVGLGVRVSRRYFSVTPSDFLVLFVLVAAASLPVFSGANYARLGVEAAVVLYGVEYILRRRGGAPWLVRCGGMLALAVVAVRGVWGLG